MQNTQALNQYGLYDIYGHWHRPFWQTTSFYLAILILTSIFLAICLRWVYKKLKNRVKFVPSWKRALNQLDALKKNNLANKEHSKEFYSALTLTLKHYLHERYGYSSDEKTDAEFLAYLDKQQFAKELLLELQTIFNGSVIIKFANGQAAQEQIDNDLQQAIAFVKKTIPVKPE